MTIRVFGMTNPQFEITILIFEITYQGFDGCAKPQANKKIRKTPKRNFADLIL